MEKFEEWHKEYWNLDELCDNPQIYTNQKAAWNHQQAKIDKLEAEKKELKKENEEQKATIKELVKALSYYANFLNWTVDGHGHVEESYDVNTGEFADRIRNDCDKLPESRAGGYGGKRARQALEKNKEMIEGE